MTQERAVLAGCCFWGMQDLIRELAPQVFRRRITRRSSRGAVRERA